VFHLMGGIVAKNNLAGAIFDLGGVVIDWNPAYVFRDMFVGDEARMEIFFRDVCPLSWNAKQDAGYPIARATEDRVALFPAWEKEIRAYYGRWIEMVGDPIPGTYELMLALKSAGYPLYALSNWSAETFPLVRNKVPAFALFEKIFLSGEYRLIKPDPRFYEAVLAEIPIPRERLVFIDDNADNVAGAKNVWLKAVRFSGAEKLRADLEAMGVAI
jgi:2-haloacid dehalogenase